MTGRSHARDQFLVLLAFAAYVVAAPSLLVLGGSRFTMISLFPVILAGLLLGPVGGFTAGVLALPLNLGLVWWLEGDAWLLFATLGGPIGSVLSILVGWVVGRVAGMRDSATRAQRRAEIEADRAFSFAPIGMLVLSTEGMIERTNEAFRAFHGAPEDDLIGRPWLDCVAAEDRSRIAATVRDLAHGTTDQAERTLTWLPTWGTPRLALVTLSLLDPDTPATSKVLVHINDLSEVHRLNLELQETIESKDRFLSSIAHEIRTPLTTVVGFIEEVSAGLDHLAREEVLEFMTTAKLASWDMRDTIEDLLAVSRLESGLLSIREEVVDLMDLAAEVTEYRAALDATTLVDLIPADEPLHAACDPLRVRQILRNLLHNAEVHGGPSVSIHGSISNGSVSITVADNGTEPDPALASRFFERRNPNHMGTEADRALGMGLYLSQGLARRMGGALSYSRVQGRTAFTLTLPHAVADGRQSHSAIGTSETDR